eukprot:NODE_4586_length_568_cov_133.739884_g3336_i0.p2 GENE.NODE_4586_length_568_cov_133.739884_g3336_i0~~NODE_4586_length_568_cov_133.739884_g3336_i0.p2  ORF type:complete len:140 (+),score=66.82 NODE_4586_length_568_cov_133.739884_g3336_i0:32-421(+)
MGAVCTNRFGFLAFATTRSTHVLQFPGLPTSCYGRPVAFDMAMVLLRVGRGLVDPAVLEFFDRQQARLDRVHDDDFMFGPYSDGGSDAGAGMDAFDPFADFASGPGSDAAGDVFDSPWWDDGPGADGYL